MKKFALLENLFYLKYVKYVINTAIRTAEQL